MPIGLCVAGGIWAVVVWAAGSLVARMIGVEAADPDPPRHTGLLVIMLGYLGVAGVAFRAAVRLPSDPGSARGRAAAAFCLGYLPAALSAAGWELIGEGSTARGVMLPLLAVLWTVGGWTLLLAALAAGDGESGKRGGVAGPGHVPAQAEVGAAQAAGTLPHTARTTTSQGDDVHDDHEHDHQTPGSPLEPAVDARSGQLERHCSQCGALIEGSDEYCQVCALEASGGELPPDEDA